MKAKKATVEVVLNHAATDVPKAPPGECVLHMHSTNHNGYGVVRFNGKNTSAHRAAWEKVNGPIPDGMQVDHLCRTRRCINVAHLELVTPQVNTLRGTGPTATNARKTTCTRGHLFTAANTYLFPDGRRGCRTCKGIREQAYRDAKRLRKQDAENGGSEGVHLVARHQGITPAQAAKEWPGLSLMIDRLIARERRKERERLWKLICKSADSLASLASFRDSIEIGEFMHDIREVFKPAKKRKPAKKGVKKR